jgi:ribosomal protein S6--L-glutamate ligase
MKIGILGISQMDYSSVLHHFRDAAKELNANVVFYVPADLIIKITNGNISVVDRDKNVIDIDALINWIPYCKFGEISYAFEALGIPVINNNHCICSCKNKILTNILLSKLDVLQPNTEFYPRLGSEICTGLSYPMVYKKKSSKYDIGCKKLCNVKDLIQLLIYESGDNDLYLQEFIENNGWNIRVIVVGDKVLGGIKKIDKKGEWQTHKTYNDKAKQYEIDRELETICLGIVKELNLHFASIDIIQGLDNRYYVLEVNATPELDIFKNVTGIDVAKEILKHVVQILM